MEIGRYLPDAEPWEHPLIGAAIAPMGFIMAPPDAATEGEEREGEEIFADGGTHTAEGIIDEGVALPILGEGVDLPHAILADGGWVDFMKYLTAAFGDEIQRLQETAAPAPVIQGITAEDDWETPAH